MVSQVSSCSKGGRPSCSRQAAPRPSCRPWAAPLCSRMPPLPPGLSSRPPPSCSSHSTHRHHQSQHSPHLFAQAPPAHACLSAPQACAQVLTSSALTVKPQSTMNSDWGVRLAWWSSFSRQSCPSFQAECRSPRCNVGCHRKQTEVVYVLD